ncbi:metal ABC transporter permease [Cytophagales bacterium LB-30]|uniref:Metal ABC transporter permease n=1 Tax=Shiella aurantiaca TaxID=3058365 RepID=A0ABT8F2G6_9BACT|nr:metal ABC transporter permease [Shiella aurantiaca]MDN4164241.1 metal ABC transporter permease [Shiella aurantiaca]
MDAFWIILSGSLVAVSCGLLGCYLILRKMAMVGDAISHAVLPGIVLAFLISGSRNSFVMLIGAGLIGLLTTFLIEFFHRKAKLQSDASIGLTFTWLFAVGVILISAFAGKVDLDQDCVLYGEIAYVPIDLWITGAGQIMGPRAVYISGSVLLIILLFIKFGYKELFLTTFDPAYATSIGISTTLWHYLLMGAVSLTTVASFEVVGAILVVALMVAPPATAYLLTEDFKKMLAYTAVLGIVVAVLGYYLAWFMNASIAGAMSVVAGILFLAALLLSPKEGIITKMLRNRALRNQTQSI